MVLQTERGGHGHYIVAAGAAKAQPRPLTPKIASEVRPYVDSHVEAALALDVHEELRRRQQGKVSLSQAKEVPAPS